MALRQCISSNIWAMKTRKMKMEWRDVPCMEQTIHVFKMLITKIDGKNYFRKI
jgi:hypothetical protein